MFLEFLGMKIRLLLNILFKLVSVLLYPKLLLPAVQLIFFCYSYVKYYTVLIVLSLLLSETVCAYTH